MGLFTYVSKMTQYLIHTGKSLRTCPRKAFPYFRIRNRINTYQLEDYTRIWRAADNRSRSFENNHSKP